MRPPIASFVRQRRSITIRSSNYLRIIIIMLNCNHQVCREEQQDLIQNIPTEDCSLEPQEDCRMETVLVPRSLSQTFSHIRLTSIYFLACQTSNPIQVGVEAKLHQGSQRDLCGDQGQPQKGEFSLLSFLLPKKRQMLTRGR